MYYRLSHPSLIRDVNQGGRANDKKKWAANELEFWRFCAWRLLMLYFLLKFASLGWRPRAKNNRASTLWINSSKNAIYILNNALESNKTRDRSFEKPQSVFSENQPMSSRSANGVGVDVLTMRQNLALPPATRRSILCEKYTITNPSAERHSRWLNKRSNERELFFARSRPAWFTSRIKDGWLKRYIR